MEPDGTAGWKGVCHGGYSIEDGGLVNAGTHDSNVGILDADMRKVPGVERLRRIPCKRAWAWTCSRYILSKRRATALASALGPAYPSWPVATYRAG